MASSHKSRYQSRKQSIIRFSLAYLPVSALTTIILVFVAYKDILYLRFRSDFFSGNQSYSEQSEQLFMDGFSAHLLRDMAENLPLVAGVLLTLVLSYTLFNAYRWTYHSLDVSKHYVNAAKVPSINIVLHYTVLYSASFAVPLLFWCLYLVLWLPYFARLPLNYIMNNSQWSFAIATTAVLTGLIILTHAGLVMTRLTARILKHS